MEIFTLLLTILGLCIFEVITSIDNAVINAEVLSGMTKRGRRIFMTWGFLFAVVVVRGLLPLLIIWIANPSLGLIGSLIGTFTNPAIVEESIEKSAPILLMAGGTFLTFLFFSWLFIEPKNFGLRPERFFQRQGAWFFAIVSILLALIVWFSLKINPLMAFGAVIGSTAFFIIHGFKQYAEEKEKELMSSNKSDSSKIAYLEVLDSVFSIDGIIGAFAFTFSVPLIFIGNGLGALILRRLTVSNIERIKRYKYLKNGAMYSIFFLGVIMVLDSFGFHIPEYLSPIVTILTVGFFFYKSKITINEIDKIERKTNG
mgnify:CR=1 FL=1